MHTRTFVLSCCLFPACLVVLGQAAPQEPPSVLRPLNGYTHKRLMGIDTRVGEISKPGGITIRYDIGKLAGNYAETTRQSQNYLWYKEQTISGRRMQIVLTKDRNLIATFPETSANFMVAVPREEDVADALLMLATYPEPSVLPAKEPK